MLATVVYGLNNQGNESRIAIPGVQVEAVSLEKPDINLPAASSTCPAPSPHEKRPPRPPSSPYTLAGPVRNIRSNSPRVSPRPGPRGDRGTDKPRAGRSSRS